MLRAVTRMCFGVTPALTGLLAATADAIDFPNFKNSFVFDSAKNAARRDGYR